MRVPEAAAVDPQVGVFSSGEGDAWYRRNAASLAGYDAATDPVHQALIEHLPQSEGCPWLPLIDLGCASGERLSALAAWAPVRLGIDASLVAIAAAKERDPQGYWWCADIAVSPIQPCYVLICSYVLHWIPRTSLPGLIERITAAVQPGGLLVINDFLPAQDVDRPYHHLPDSGVMTYKRDYGRLFDGPFVSVSKRAYPYDVMDQGCVEVLRRA